MSAISKMTDYLGSFPRQTIQHDSNQVCAPTIDAKEVELDWLYEDLQHLLELISKKRCPFHHRGIECKSRAMRVTPFLQMDYCPQ